MKFVDLGANVGVVSLPVAALGCAVLSIEALAANAAVLSRAALLNKFNNMHVIHAAAYDSLSLVKIKGYSAWGVVDTASDAGGEVYADTIANLMRLHGFADADLLKMDIEGSELASLSGFESIVAENKNLEVIYESNSHTCNLFGHSVHNLMARFEELGFSLYLMRTGELVSTTSEDVHSKALEDILATRRRPDELPWPVRTASLDEKLIELKANLQSSNNHVRQHVPREIKRLSNDVANRPEWAVFIKSLVE